jgi:hypothetical protein
VTQVSVYPVNRWDRPLARATAVVFVASSAFPVMACLARTTAAFPSWYGGLDITLAFLLASLAIMVIGRGHGRIDQRIINETYRAYRALIHVILVMVVVFHVAGDRINWIDCAPGFAWRAWLLLYALPSWIALYGLGAERVIATPPER